jgi:hypothetical protein
MLVDEAAFEPIRLAAIPDAKRKPATARRASLSSIAAPLGKNPPSPRYAGAAGRFRLEMHVQGRCRAGLATLSATARPRFSRMIRRFP